MEERQVGSRGCFRLLGSLLTGRRDEVESTLVFDPVRSSEGRACQDR